MTTDSGGRWEAMLQRSGEVLNICYVLCIALTCCCNSYFYLPQLKFEMLSVFPLLVSHSHYSFTIQYGPFLHLPFHKIPFDPETCGIHPVTHHYFHNLFDPASSNHYPMPRLLQRHMDQGPCLQI